MGDEFNINKVEQLINTELNIEISDVSKVIKEMISIKNNRERKSQKKSKPYNILDKIQLNSISSNYAEKIKRNHIDSYDVVDDALVCLEDLEASIRNDLYDYYWDVYMDILIDLNINNNDYESIRRNSDIIYASVSKNIRNQLFTGRKSDIPTDKIITYISAITSYVFYKCKFLIPIERYSYSS